MSSRFPPLVDMDGERETEQMSGSGGSSFNVSSYGYPSPPRTQREGFFPSSSFSPNPSPRPTNHGPPDTAPPRPSLRRGNYERQVEGLTLGLANLAQEKLFAHPCVVLRRQCQINASAKHPHRTPFTLAGPIYNLQQQQGIGCLWKGVTSITIVQGLSHGFEAFVATSLGLPRSLNPNSNLNDAVKHFFLKGISVIAVTPFYAATLMETVQSAGASDRPGVLDFAARGVERVGGDFVGGREASRRLPIWTLLPPALLHSLSHYLLSETVNYVTYTTVKRHLQRKNARHKRMTTFDQFFPDLFAVFSSRLIADALLYPLETVIHRLYLQGTRVLFDNLDTGLEVISVNTRYEGFFDCIGTIYRTEGWTGFYKGFGALVLQYAIHYSTLRIIRFAFEQLEELREKQATLTPPLLPPSLSPPLHSSPPQL